MCWIWCKSPISSGEGVSYLDGFPVGETSGSRCNTVGETSGLDASPVGETSRSRCARSAGACPPRSPSSRGSVLGPMDLRERAPFFPVARGPVPRECPRPRTMARDRPSPYGNARRFFRSAGDRPPRTLECAYDGEGNPLAGAYRFMKHPEFR